MKEEILTQLIEFIEEVRWKYNFPLERATRLFEDLKLTGNDAVDFIIAFGKKFDVDVSQFKAADYFEGEGMNFLTGNGTNKKTLTLGHMEKAIHVGKLNEDVINS